ncbi:MAG: MerR family transcriptional regulator [Chloroflexota bacterium]
MFRIGEFSKIAQTPISQLRYYDEIGLFQPAEIDESTGYRHYSATQLPQLNRIIALKELGLTLEQIRRMVSDDIAADEIRGMLALKKSQIEQTLQDEIARLRTVEARLHQIEHEGELRDDDVVIKPISAQPYLSMRRVLPNLFDGVAIMAELTTRLPMRLGSKSLGHFVVVIHGDAFSLENADVEMGYLLNDSVESPLRLPSGERIETSVLPAVESAVTAVRVGPFENGYHPYAAMGRWVEENNYSLAGPAREEFIVIPAPGDMEDPVVEIQIPVVPKQTITDRLLRGE